MKSATRVAMIAAASTAALTLVTFGLALTAIPILTQYNPHGLFIALEEAGYLLMSFSFLFVALVFTGGRLESAIRWLFAGAFVLAVVALMLIAARYGLDRQDRFEVIVISVNWLVLIVNGTLLGLVFRRRLRAGLRSSE